LYWLTPEGLKSWKKKINGILKMQLPQEKELLSIFMTTFEEFDTMLLGAII
jgi:hypothetical protein